MVRNGVLGGPKIYNWLFPIGCSVLAVPYLTHRSIVLSSSHLGRALGSWRAYGCAAAGAGLGRARQPTDGWSRCLSCRRPHLDIPGCFSYPIVSLNAAGCSPRSIADPNFARSGRLVLACCGRRQATHIGKPRRDNSKGNMIGLFYINGVYHLIFVRHFTNVF